MNARQLLVFSASMLASIVCAGAVAQETQSQYVQVAEIEIDPAQLEVASGTPVTFVNEDTVAHTLSFEGLFDTPELPAGSSYPVTLEGTGTVTYTDEANPEVQGTITLGGADQGEATLPEGSADDASQVAGDPTG